MPIYQSAAVVDAFSEASESEMARTAKAKTTLTLALLSQVPESPVLHARCMPLLVWLCGCMCASNQAINNAYCAPAVHVVCMHV
jgi:hypothetical protein